MSKSLEEKREARLREIAELTKQRDVINAKLNFLTGVTEASNTKIEQSPIPAGFSTTKEVERLFEEKNQWRILEATDALKKKYPAYNIQRRQVHGSLVYLQDRKKIMKVANERGLFVKAGSG